MFKPQLDQALFRLALKDIAAGAAVSGKGEELVIGEHTESQLSAEQMAHVLGFIRSHAQFLEPSDSQTLLQLQDRLSPTVQGEIRQDIATLFQKLHKYDPNKVDAKLPPVPKTLLSSCSSLELSQSATLLCAQLGSALEDSGLFLTGNLSVVRELPFDWKADEVLLALKQVRTELGQQSLKLCMLVDQLIAKYETPLFVLLANLTIALNDPSVTINDDLSIRRGKPENWNRSAVLAELEKVRSSLDLKHVQLAEVIDRLIEEHQPPRLVKLALCIEESEEGDLMGAVQMTMRNWLQSGLPVLTTKALISGSNGLPHYCQIYSQKNGGLALCVPPGIKIEELGIDLEEFEKVPEQTALIPFEPFDHEKDLTKTLKQPEMGPEIHRLIVAIGHGSPASLVEARICGLPAIKFQEMLQVLLEKGLSFLTVISCFSGGENITRMTIPSGAVPCPILMWNATESVALGDPEQLKVAAKLLDEAGSKLYAQLASGRTPRLSHPLQRRTLRKMGQSLIRSSRQGIPESHIDVLNLQNMQTVLLPSRRPDIPRVTYMGAIPQNVMDLDEAIRKKQRKECPTLGKPVEIQVNGEQIRTLFCSGPLLPAVVMVIGKNSTVGILARGGNSVHFIDELRIPGITLGEFILASANKVMRISHGVPARLLGANILFHIEKLLCKEELGNERELYDVAISLTVSKAEVTYTDKTGRHYRREIALNMNQGMPLFSISQSAVNVRGETIVEVDSDLIFSRFDQFLRCCPSEEHLLATTAGQLSASDLCNELAGKMRLRHNPIYVEIYRLALEPRLDNQLLDKILALPSEEQLPAADRALRLAIAADHEAAVAQLLNHFGPWERTLAEGKSALHFAAERGSVAVTKMLLKRIKNPDQPDDVGRTPLHYGVIEYQAEIVEILLDLCSDMAPDMTLRSPLECALLSRREGMIRSFLNRKKEPIERDSERSLLVKMSCDPAFMRTLIDSKRIPLTGPLIENRSFLECYLRLLGPVSSLKLLLETGCAEKEVPDGQGHHLFTRLLLEDVPFSEETLLLIVNHFPLSEQDKILLSAKWLEKQQKNPKATPYFAAMKILGIPAEPAADWQKVLLLLMANIQGVGDVELRQKYLAIGVTIDWKKLGIEISNGGGISCMPHTLPILEQFHPDLAADETWRVLCEDCIMNEKYDWAARLIDCGATPTHLDETRHLSSDQLFAWLREDPNRIQPFLQTLVSGVKIDPTSSEAKICLALLLGRSKSKLNRRENNRLNSAIKMLIEKGVEYDPNHTGIGEEDWARFQANSMDTWIAASLEIPGLAKSPQFIELINEVVRSGHLTTETINSLRHAKIAFDYRLLSEETLVGLILQDRGFITVLSSVGIPISDALASKAFSQMLEKNPGSWMSEPLQKLSRYNIDQKEFILINARNRLIHSAQGENLLPVWFVQNLSLLIELGTPLECSDDLIMLFDKIGSEKLIELVGAHFPNQVSMARVMNILQNYVSTFNLPHKLLMAGAVAADDPALAQLPSFIRSKIEEILYERGIRPSEEECIHRYWMNQNDRLDAVIRRDLKPDPKSVRALKALTTALENKQCSAAIRLLELGVPFQSTGQNLEILKSFFDDFIGDHQLELLEKLASHGLDLSNLREEICKKVDKSLQDSRYGLVQIRVLTTLIQQALPLTFKSPTPAVSYAIENESFCSGTLQTLREWGYDFIPHREELAHRIARAKYGYLGGEDEIAIIKICPSVVQPDLLPTWLKGQLPIPLLRQIEVSNGDRHLLKAHIESRVPAILDGMLLSENLSFIDNYIDPDQWKKPETIEALIKLLKYGHLVAQVIRLAIKVDILDDLITELPKKYIICLSYTKDPDLSTVKLLIDAKVPIPAKDVDEVLNILFMYDELSLAKAIQELPKI